MVISACKPAEAPPAAQLGEEEEEEEGGGLARLTARPPSQCAHGLRRSGVDTEGQPMRPASGCRESWLPDVGRGAASPYALAWWFQMAMDRRWFYSLSFVCRARGSPGTLQRDAPADLQRPVAAHTPSLDPGGSPEHPPSQEGEGLIAPSRHAHTRLLGDGRGRVPSDTEATSHTPRPLPGRGRGGGSSCLPSPPTSSPSHPATAHC